MFNSYYFMICIVRMQLPPNCCVLVPSPKFRSITSPKEKNIVAIRAWPRHSPGEAGGALPCVAVSVNLNGRKWTSQWGTQGLATRAIYRFLSIRTVVLLTALLGRISSLPSTNAKLIWDGAAFRCRHGRRRSSDIMTPMTMYWTGIKAIVTA